MLCDLQLHYFLDIHLYVLTRPQELVQMLCQDQSGKFKEEGIFLALS